MTAIAEFPNAQPQQLVLTAKVSLAVLYTGSCHACHQLTWLHDVTSGTGVLRPEVLVHKIVLRNTHRPDLTPEYS